MSQWHSEFDSLRDSTRERARFHEPFHRVVERPGPRESERPMAPFPACSWCSRCVREQRRCPPH